MQGKKILLVEHVVLVLWMNSAHILCKPDRMDTQNKKNRLKKSRHFLGSGSLAQAAPQTAGQANF